MFVATQENFKHGATLLVQEQNRGGVHAHKLTFNQRNVVTVFGFNMPGKPFFAAQVKVTMAVETGR